MNIKFAIVCDNAFVDAQGRLNIIQTFDNISTPGFPAIHPRVSIVTSYSLENSDDKTAEYKQTLKIINIKTGKEVYKRERAIKPLAGRDSSVQFITNIVGFAFPNEGRYEITTQLNEKPFGTVASINIHKDTN